MSAAKKLPELLAPAGSPACLPAAVAGGADAVYLGLSRFSARARAENFLLEELAHHLSYLHGHGLRCYVTLNTLIRDGELAAAVAMAEGVASAGADALILQDLGLWRILRRELPDLELHASTQMTVHTVQQIRVLAELGARRIILARELSWRELQRCADAARSEGVATECFVHGALCYAYSGQCLMSAMASGRSANRGACEQNCRFEYRGLGRREPLLALRDLNLLERIPQLVATGVAALKIEGRLKDADYVLTVCQAYRAALEAYREGQQFDSTAWQQRLREVFARPFTCGPVDGVLGASCRVSHHDAAEAVPDAHLTSISRRAGIAELASRDEVQAGHGFRFVLANGTAGGFLVTRAASSRPDHWRCTLRLPRHGPPLPTGLPLFRNRDQQLDANARQIMARVPLKPAGAQAIPLHLTVVARPGRPLELRGASADGRCAAVLGPTVESATAHPLDRALLETTVGALGGSGFSAGAWTLDLDPHAFVPSSKLKTLRRELVQQLAAQPPAEVQRWRLPAARPRQQPTRLIAAVRSIAAARAVAEAGVDELWLDDPQLDLWNDTPPRLPELPPKLWLRHPAAAPVSPHLAAIGLPVVAGHLGALRAAGEAGLRVIADCGLNLANHATADALAELGAEAAVLALELSPDHIRELVSRTELPCIAIAGGRPLLMSSRQDHDLAGGRLHRMEATRRPLAYSMQRHVAGLTLIRGDELWDRVDAIVELVPELHGILLELGTLEDDEACAISSRARTLVTRKLRSTLPT